MSEQELCAAYGVDPEGPFAYEACDRIEQLLQYRSLDYLEQVRFKGSTAREFEFEDERRYATDSEQWANERGLEKLAHLAEKVTAHLEVLGRFSLRVAREVGEEVMNQVRAEHDLRDWPTRLQHGDFDPSEVIATINSRTSDDAESGEIYADACMESLYPFVASLASEAQARFDGHLGHALAARFQHPPAGQWTHYRGFSARIWQGHPAMGDDSESEPSFIDVVGGTDHSPSWSFPPVVKPADALTMLRTAVDDYWRQNPPVDTENNKAQ